MNKNQLTNFATSKLNPLVTYLKKQQDNEKFNKSIEITATFILIIFFLIFAIRPTALTISGLVGEIKSKETQKTQLKTKINQIIKAQDVFAEIQGKYDLIEQALPDRPSFYQASVQLQNIASLSGTPITDLTFNVQAVSTNKTDESIDNHVQNYSVPYRITGSFNQNILAISEILDNRRIFFINRVNLVKPVSKVRESSPSAVPAGSIDINFTPITYYWSPANEQTKNK